MTVKRRMAPENAATRTHLMDAVERLMREQGYAAVSARTVAAAAGLKYPTVFYYFETMDDLLLTTYQRRTQSVLARTEAALRSERPLHALWEAASDPFDAALSLEYMAMSNHNKLIRAETITFGERIRWLVADRLAPRLRSIGRDKGIFSPLGITLSLTSLGGLLGFESALGISGGHEEMKSIVEWIIHQVEPEKDKAAPTQVTRRNQGRRRGAPT